MLNASLQLSTRLELFGRIENLLDESYHEVIDFRAPARGSVPGAAGAVMMGRGRY